VELFREVAAQKIVRAVEKATFMAPATACWSVASFQITVGLVRLCQRIDMLNAQLEFLCRDHAEESIGSRVRFLLNQHHRIKQA
jgi:hypothetical protein